MVFPYTSEKPSYLSEPVKKCGKEGCHFCKPPRLPLDIFENLKVFPDPVKKTGSDRYEDFSDVYGKTTTEKDRPSLSQAKKSKEKPKKPFRITAEMSWFVVSA